jgi:peptidoglycan hydrolase-like protein with peptidoglycan-binding domain
MFMEPIQAVPKPQRRRAGRFWRWTGAGATILLAGSGIGWAAANVFTPAQDVLDSTRFTHVKVVAGEVGSSINLDTAAEWTPQPVGSNLSAGVITSVSVEAGQEIGSGSTLYTVNLRPVVIAQGMIPSFRPILQGAAGADVAQLQSFLTSLGLYGEEVDGNFDWATSQAVKAWQKGLGLGADGLVQAGDIIYVPNLPARVVLDTEKVKRGDVLSGGEDVVMTLPPAPALSMAVTDMQATLVPVGARVEIAGPVGEAWEGFVVSQQADEQGGITLVLGGKDGERICGETCGTIPIIGKSFLRSRVITVEAVAGLTVPSAALLTRADGSVAVIDSDGIEKEVAIVTSARGMSVIDGVNNGTMVRIPVSGE